MRHRLPAWTPVLLSCARLATFLANSLLQTITAPTLLHLAVVCSPTVTWMSICWLLWWFSMGTFCCVGFLTLVFSPMPLLCSAVYHHPCVLCTFLCWHLSSFPSPFQCICLLSSKCIPQNQCPMTIHKPTRSSEHLQPVLSSPLPTSKSRILELECIKMFFGR